MRVLSLLWLSAGLGACAPEPEPLVDHWSWAPVAQEEDPMPEHRPDEVDCPVSAWGWENGALEVQTGLCTYAVLGQPPQVPLRRRDRIVGDIWHEDLDAAEPATGHVALLLGDTVLWEATAAIPGPAATWSFDVPIPRDADLDAPIIVHLHNHGWNSWTIGTLLRDR